MASPESPIEAIEMQTEAPASGSFVGRFGLDPWLLLAQVVNFLIVLYVLNRFVFRPLLQTMRERNRSIERGLADAEAAAAARAAAAAEKDRVLAAARAEAGETVRGAEAEASRVRESVLRRAEEEAAAMHDRAEREAGELKAGAVAAAAGEVGGLVVDVAERVLARSLTPKDRAAYREAALKELKTKQ